MQDWLSPASYIFGYDRRLRDRDITAYFMFYFCIFASESTADN